MTKKENLYQRLVEDLTSEDNNNNDLLKENSFPFEEEIENYETIKNFWNSYHPNPGEHHILEKTEKKLGFTYQTKTKSKRDFVLRLAASFFILLSIGVVGFYYLKLNAITAVSISEYKSGPNEVKEVTLSDGTKVWLNGSSTIYALEPFLNNQREVRLIGEAYFEVTSNPHKPFLVKTPGLTTKVLGTHFNIISFPKEAAQEISLYEGKVELIDENNSKNNIIINPGEQAYFSRENGGFYVKEFGIEAPAAWRNGVLNFYDEKLKHIVLTLERKFQTKIIIKDENIGDLRFTANFKDESLEKILQLLSEAQGFNYKKTSGGYLIEK